MKVIPCFGMANEVFQRSDYGSGAYLRQALNGKLINRLFGSCSPDNACDLILQRPPTNVRGATARWRRPWYCHGIDFFLTDSLEEMERWVLSMGTHATVIGPERLRERLSKATKEL